MQNLQKLLATYTQNPSIKPQLIWSFIGVDYKFLEYSGINGVLSFEDREPGCIGSLAKAFLCMLDWSQDENTRMNISQATTAEQQTLLVKKIVTRLKFYHLLCANFTYTPSQTRRTLLTPGEYRENPVCYGFSTRSFNFTHNGSEAGATNLMQRKFIRGPLASKYPEKIEKYYRIENRLSDFDECTISGSYLIHANQATRKNIATIVEALTLRLLQDIHAAKTVEKTLEMISEYIQDLMCLHPFSDCNNRVLVSLLFNEILFDLGYTPTVLKEPNIFDGFTPKELVGNIQAGQKLFKNICNNYVALPEHSFMLPLLFISIDSNDFRLVKEVLHNFTLKKQVRNILTTARKIYLKELQANKEPQKINTLLTSPTFIKALLKSCRLYAYDVELFLEDTYTLFHQAADLFTDFLVTLAQLTHATSNNGAKASLWAIRKLNDTDELQKLSLSRIIQTLNPDYILMYIFACTGITIGLAEIGFVLSNPRTLAVYVPSFNNIIIEPSFIKLLCANRNEAQLAALSKFFSEKLTYQELTPEQVHTACVCMLRYRVNEKFVVDFFLDNFKRIQSKNRDLMLNNHFDLIESLLFLLRYQKEYFLAEIIVRLPTAWVYFYGNEETEYKQAVQFTKRMIFSNFPEDRHKELLSALERKPANKPNYTSMVCWRRLCI